MADKGGLEIGPANLIPVWEFPTTPHLVTIEQQTHDLYMETLDLLQEMMAIPSLLRVPILALSLWERVG
ncbi:MAG: hypothetical protein ACOH12_08670 [Parvibaculaceae bacterium]